MINITILDGSKTHMPNSEIALNLFKIWLFTSTKYILQHFKFSLCQLNCFVILCFIEFT